MSQKSIENKGCTPGESLDSQFEKKKLRKKPEVSMALVGLVTACSVLAGCGGTFEANSPASDQSQVRGKRPAAKPTSPLELPSNVSELDEIQEKDGFVVEAFGNIDPGISLENVTKLLTISNEEVREGNEALLGQKMANALEFMYNGGANDADFYENLYKNPDGQEDLMDNQADETVDAVMNAFYGDDWEMASKEILDFAEQMTDIVRGGVVDRLDSHIINLDIIEPKNEDRSPRYDQNVIRTRIDLVGVKRSMDGDAPTYNIVFNRMIEGISEDAAVFNQEGFEYNDIYHHPDYFTERGRREGISMSFDLERTKEQGHPAIDGIDQGADESLAYPS